MKDLEFRWVWLSDNGDIDISMRLHTDCSAYVRHIIFRKGVDPCIRTGVLSLVLAIDPGAVIEYHIKGVIGSYLITYSDISGAQVKTFEDKDNWFQDTFAHICGYWKNGHMHIYVRHKILLSNSMKSVMSLIRKDLRNVWRFQLVGEVGIDAVGLASEWFQLVTEDIFYPDMGLWKISATNQMCMTIKSASS